MDLWEVGSGRLIKRLESDYNTVSVIVFLPKGNLLASVEDGEVKLREVSSGKVIDEPEYGKGKVTSLAFSPDGRILAYGGTQIILWDVDIGAVIKEFKKDYGKGSTYSSLAFSFDGKLLAALIDFAIELWRIF